MVARLMVRWTLVFQVIFATSANAGNIVFTLEEPFPSGTATGVSNIRGWAVSTAGIDHVELRVNGAYKTDIPYGGTRGDVGNAYPEYPDSRYSGFSMAFNYGLLNTGANQFTITAIDNDGSSKTISRSFQVAKFQSSFFPQTSPLDITDSMPLSLGDNALLTNADMDGSKNAVLVGWDKGKQDITIKNTIPAAAE